MKYILKESELRSLIKEAVAEELNESIGNALGSALLNTAKYAALGAVAPGALAGKGVLKANDILTGNDTIGGTVKSFFGDDSKTRAEKQRERLMSTKNISYEYGRPETVPGFGRKFKLDKKSEIIVPEEILDNKGKCIQWGSRTGDWGSFGWHYHDDGDRMWQRIFKDKENALLKNCRNDQSKLERLKKKYKRVLVDWLKKRDREYEIYIKNA